MQDIVASLKYGRVWSKKWVLYWDVYIFIGGICSTCAFISLFGSARDFNNFFVYFCCGLILGGIGLYIILKNMLLKKRIKVWVQDAIILNAFVWKIAHGYSRTGFPVKKNVKIKIQFFHENNFIFRCSGTKESNGYDTVFYQFIDKEIDILYSPKYDEVMLLKTR